MSAAVPVMVTWRPAGRVEPDDGELMTDVGAVVSVDWAAATSPDRSVAGCTPMSASRFTVACCMRLSAAADPRSWLLSSPQDHWTVPAPKTSAPLLARYRVRRWVAVPEA
jgi:hypothetical protein